MSRTPKQQDPKELLAKVSELTLPQRMQFFEDLKQILIDENAAREKEGQQATENLKKINLNGVK